MSATPHFGGDIRQVTRCAEQVSDFSWSRWMAKRPHTGKHVQKPCWGQRVADDEADADGLARQLTGRPFDHEGSCG